MVVQLPSDRRQLDTRLEQLRDLPHTWISSAFALKMSQ